MLLGLNIEINPPSGSLYYYRHSILDQLIRIVFPHLLLTTETRPESPFPASSSPRPCSPRSPRQTSS